MRDSTAAPLSWVFEIRLLNRLRFVEEDAASVNPMRHHTWNGRVPWQASRAAMASAQLTALD